MSHDVVADALNKIMNSKRSGKALLEIKSFSSLLISVLAIAKLKGYIKDYRIEDSILKIEIANLHNCNAIKPRFTISVSDIEKYERRYLPAKEFGILIISTSKGLITNQTAKAKNLGGSLIAYMY